MPPVAWVDRPHDPRPPLRPIQPPKKPEAAPFFRPTVAGLSATPQFDTSAGLGMCEHLVWEHLVCEHLVWEHLV